MVFVYIHTKIFIYSGICVCIFLTRSPFIKKIQKNTIGMKKKNVTKRKNYK